MEAEDGSRQPGQCGCGFRQGREPEVPRPLGRIRTVHPPSGATLYTIVVMQSRIGGSTLRVLPEVGVLAFAQTEDVEGSAANTACTYPYQDELYKGVLVDPH